MKRYLLLALFSTGCVPIVPPVVVPPPPLPVRMIQANIIAAESHVPAGTKVVLSDDQPVYVPCVIVALEDGHDRAVCAISTEIPIGPLGGHIDITAPGYGDRRVNFLLTGKSQDLEDIHLRPDAPAVPPMSRLTVRGGLQGGFYDQEGRHVPALSATEFQLVEFVAHGRGSEAVGVLARMKAGGVRFVRVLLMANWLFTLTPAEGIAALPGFLDLAQSQGVYVEVVMLADTKSFPSLDYGHTADQVGLICATHPACGAIEIGNELAPLHETQSDKLGDLHALQEMRIIIRRRGDIPVSLGSTHGDTPQDDPSVGDESEVFKDGDFLTVHGARGAGDKYDWRWVRHTNEQRALAYRLGRFVWNDESRKDDLAPDKQLGIALLCRMFRLGDTFHYDDGRFAIAPSGAALTAFEARARGWAAIPLDWSGVYINAGQGGSPVKSATGAVRVYSAVSGGEAYVLVLGADDGMTPEWNDGWPTRELVISEGRVRLWHVSR